MGCILFLSMNSPLIAGVLYSVFAEGIGISDGSGGAIPHRHLGCEHFGALEVEDCTISRQK